jgi:hypothetical protein
MLRENIQVLGDCNVQRNTRRRPTIILRRAAPIFFGGTPQLVMAIRRPIQRSWLHPQ